MYISLALDFQIMIWTTIIAFFPLSSACQMLPPAPAPESSAITKTLACKPDQYCDHISEPLLHRFELMSGYVKAASCKKNIDGLLSSVACNGNNQSSCPEIKSANATTILEVATVDDGFIAIDNVGKFIIVAMSGAHHFGNWETNLDFRKVKTDFLCTKCRVHRGFLKVWKELRKLVIPVITDAIEKNPGYPLVLAGHSMGGAVLTIAAADIRHRSQHWASITELYTFGAPRVGNRCAAHFMSIQSNYSYRVTNDKDPVPRIPSRGFGYVHTLPEYFMDWQPRRPVATDFQVIYELESKLGSIGTDMIDKEVKKHSLYFGNMSCNDTLSEGG